jgi:hypothetical protein
VRRHLAGSLHCLFVDQNTAFSANEIFKEAKLPS